MRELVNERQGLCTAEIYKGSNEQFDIQNKICTIVAVAELRHAVRFTRVQPGSLCDLLSP